MAIQNPFVPVGDGDLGSNIRVKLNNIGGDNEISIRFVSEIANVLSEIAYYITGSIVYSIAEKQFYKYNGTIWVVDTDIPNVNDYYTKLQSDNKFDLLGAASDVQSNLTSHVNNTANPHSTTASQVGSPALVNPSVDGNLVAFNGTAGLQKDSGKKPSDFDVAGAASTVQSNLTSHVNATGTSVHGLGSASTFADTAFLKADGSITADNIPLSTSHGAPTYAEGQIYWDNVNHTLAIMTETSQTVIQVGQEQVVRVVNKTGVQIDNGQAVYISGAQGNRPKASLAKADSETTSYVIGLATMDIPDNQEGYVTVNGVVNGYDTRAFSTGDKLYISSSTAGALTKTRPPAPNHSNFVGIALNSTVQGSIYVDTSYGQELDELHDVLISNPTNNQVLIYDSVNGYWKNITITPAIIGSPALVSPSVTNNFVAFSGITGGQKDSGVSASSFDAAGAANTVQGNLNTHVGLTGSNVHGLGTISTQNSNNVSITGGSISGISLTISGIKRNVVTKTASYLLTANDDIVRFTASGTATLPTATGSGKEYTIIVDSTTASVIVDANGSETINRQLTQSISDGGAMTIVDTATGIWNII